MSEVQSRPSAPRGRGSARGGRGGFSSRGGRGGRAHPTNGDKAETHTAAIEDEGEVGQLKKQYGSKVSTIKEMFPDWTDEDVVFALQETDGDLETTVDRITDGTLSQWSEISKNNKKDRSRSKAKDTPVTSFGDSTNVPRPSRGGRAGFDTGRGRGRGTDRGRGGRGRGASVAQTNGSRKENTEVSVPTTEASAWDTTASNDAAPAWDTQASTEKPAEESWGATETGSGSVAATAAKAASSIIPDGVKKSWASIFAPAPAPKKAPEPVERPAEPVKHEEPIEPPTKELETPIAQPALVEPIVPAPVTPAAIDEPEVAITPSKDELTEDNVEQLPDASAPAPTATAASTAASSWDTKTVSGTPYSAIQQGQPQAIRPPTSGFQASALKATGSSGRTPSYQRRVLDQEEAVRMPGNREVDRTAVQFGAFNLNGSGEEDVDGDREEPETRTQPPQHSPVAPRASLPPAPSTSVPEAYPTPKQSTGLPAASHPTAAPGLPSPQPLSSAQSASQPGPQGNAQYNQYSRFPQSGDQAPSSLPQKPYDAFSQQAPSTQSPFEGYPNHSSQSQAAPPSGQSGAFSSAPNDYSSYYPSDPQQRSAYQNYYNQYGAQGQGAQGQQDGAASQQRSFSGYNVPQSEGTSQFPQSAAQQAPSRYATAGEGQNSGHTTPNPSAQSQQPGASQAPQPGPQNPGNYPYGHPYYSSPYYAAYVNNYQQYGGGNYPAGPYGGKGGHQQPYQGYGMSPGAPYDQHASSPAAGGFGGASSLHGRDSALGGGLSEYGRAGSAQSAQTPQSLGGSGAFGGHDAFGRGSSYQGQNQGHYNANQSQQGGADDLKPFGDSKSANGPSPSLSQANRPGSATNTAPGSVLPPPQSQQGSYGGYPAHLQQGGHGSLHGSQAGGQSQQYGGLGGAAGQGQNSQQYGGYQAAFGGNYYGGNSGQQQQRGGWGGNYGH